MEEVERLQVFLSLIDTASEKAQMLAGSAATALGVFMAAFVVAFVEETYGHPFIDLSSEVLFILGSSFLLRCIFQATRPLSIENPLDERELEKAWRGADGLYHRAARSFWIGTVLLALSVAILITEDILTDVGLLTGKP